MGSSEINLNRQMVSIMPDVVVELFEIDFSNLQYIFEEFANLLDTSPSSEPIYRFSSMQNGTNPIYWKGNAYQPLPIEASGFESKSDGKMPRPTLRIASPVGLLSKIVKMNKDFLGCKVTRKRTYAGFLDNNNYLNRNLNDLIKNPFGMSDPGASFLDDVFYINKKSGEQNSVIEFELTSVLEIEDSMVPARVILSRYCNWTYRCKIGCGYKGLPIETGSSKSLTSNFSKDSEGFIDPEQYPNGISDIPEWSRYGKDGSPEQLKGYKLNDVVKIVNEKSKNPYVSAPKVFVCAQEHQFAKDFHPFFNADHWLEDACTKSIESCKKRFSRDDTSLIRYNRADDLGLRFGGFPGTEQYPIER